LHPQFHLVDAVADAYFSRSAMRVARSDNQLLLYLNTWLLNAEGDGTIDGLYKYWMFGSGQGNAAATLVHYPQRPRLDRIGCPQARPELRI